MFTIEDGSKERDETVHEEDVKLSKEDEVEAYNDEVKIPHESHHHVAGQLPPWAYVLIGALGGAVLLLLFSYSFNGWNLPGDNTGKGQGRLNVINRNVSDDNLSDNNRQVPANIQYQLQRTPFGGRFGRMGLMDENFFNEFDDMQRIHDQMLRNFTIDDGGTVLDARSVTRNLNGSLSFYSQGKQYSVPYSVDNQQLVLKTGELKSYLDSNKNAVVSIKIIDGSNNVLADYSKPDDFAKADLRLNLKRDQSYILDLSVKDEKGNQVMQVREGI